jgi:hypothetical protein
VVGTDQVAAQSRAWICGRSPAGIGDSNPAGGVDVCRVFPGRGPCDELITHPEYSYRLWYVVVGDLETSRMRRRALGRSKKKLTNY